jgi:hypothetical protein
MNRLRSARIREKERWQTSRARKATATPVVVPSQACALWKRSAGIVLLSSRFKSVDGEALP